VRPNRVFVTSQSYVLADLGGLPGADAACAERAEAANLPGTFVAWLSSSTVNARDRLGSANGWINVRGNPFADRAAELLDALQVYYPIVFDETGERVTSRIATGTQPDGTVAPHNCEDYTSKVGTVVVVTGNATGGSAVWTADEENSCNQAYRIYCFEVSRNASLYPTPSQGRTVFVSSEPFVLGNQGRTAADAQCAEDAAAADLSGTFVALLPTATESALARLSQPSRPWVRPDGAMVAGATSSVSNAPLASAITERADGKHVGGVPLFGAEDITQKAVLHCEDWKNPNAAASAVIHGVAGYTDARWYAAVTAACSDPAHVLCVEQ
jgi:hypothetical protein